MKRLNVLSAAPLLTLAVCFLFFLPAVYADDVSPPDAPEERIPVQDIMDNLRAEIPDLDLEELQEKEREIMALITGHAQDTQDLQARYQEVRVEARAHETIRAMQEEIHEMRLQLEAALDALPEVKEVRDELERDKNDLYELMQLRTEIRRLIALAEHEDEVEVQAEEDVFE